jgi:flagellin
MMQIADGALSKIGDILTRMKTLAVQSGSEQLSDTERAMLDTEFLALRSEVDRIAQDTEFNGVKLIAGTAGSVQTLFNSITSGTENLVQQGDGIQKVTFDSGTSAGVYQITHDSTNKLLTVKNLETGQVESIDVTGESIAAGASKDFRFNQLGLTLTLDSQFNFAADIAETTNNAHVGDGSGVIEASSIKISGTNAMSTTGVDKLQAATNIVFSIEGANTGAVTLNLAGTSFVSGSTDLSTTGTKTVVLSDGDNNQFTVEFNISTVLTAADVTGTGDTLSVGGLGTLVYTKPGAAGSNTSSFSFKLGTGNTANVDDVTFTIDAATLSSFSLTTSQVNTKLNSDTASTAITSAIDTLNTARANVGAGQNRLDFAAANLATAIENSESARSSLMDLDVASEMTKFTSAQVLLQAGVSMLAQANQLPQNLLRLFQ